MSVERTTEGLEIRLRSSGRGRIVSATFLAAWLCGWAVGECVVLWILIKGSLALLTGTPPDSGRAPLQMGPAVMFGLFLLMWLCFWTIGGIAAWSELLQLLWGEDRIRVASGRLTVTWKRWPFRASRTFDRDAIRAVGLAERGEALSLTLTEEQVQLSSLGDRAQRLEAAAALRSEVMVPEVPVGAPMIPGEWQEIRTPEGERALVKTLATRRTQARVALSVTLLLALATLAVARDVVTHRELVVPAATLLALTVAIGGGALWLAVGRNEWRIGSGHLTLRRRWASDVSDLFEARSLLLERTTDSDGDAWYDLWALSSPDPATRASVVPWRRPSSRDRRSIAREMNKGHAVRDLARWLSRESGVPLEDRTTPEARAAEIVELRALLEQSGRFGRWAIRWIDRLGKSRER